MFEVRQRGLHEAMQIFSQFFTAPLMHRESAGRELKAIDRYNSLVYHHHHHHHHRYHHHRYHHRYHHYRGRHHHQYRDHHHPHIVLIIIHHNHHHHHSNHHHHLILNDKSMTFSEFSLSQQSDDARKYQLLCHVSKEVCHH
jgi:hypothetical protein